MPDRDVMLHNIEAAYAARTRADREELATYWAPARDLPFGRRR